MIFITVGTHTQQFDRLIKALDELAGTGKVKDMMVAQIGNCTYEPKNMKWFRFTTFDELNRIYKSADVFVTHGGAGSILNGLDNGKPVIAVPRLKKYDEHVNDHQLDLVKFLARKGKLIAVYDTKDLAKAIASARRRGKIRTENKICGEIEKFLRRV